MALFEIMIVRWAGFEEEVADVGGAGGQEHMPSVHMLQLGWITSGSTRSWYYPSRLGSCFWKRGGNAAVSEFLGYIQCSDDGLIYN